MDERIKRILHRHFNKYNVPDEAIVSAARDLSQMLVNPAAHKTGATVMTEAASRAGDNVTFEESPQAVKKIKPTNPAKPEVL